MKTYFLKSILPPFTENVLQNIVSKIFLMIICHVGDFEDFMVQVASGTKKEKKILALILLRTN